MERFTIGQRIKSAREHAHITQEELAAAVGCTSQHISAIERGIKTPKLDTFVKIANTLQVSADVLLQDVVSCPADQLAREFSSMAATLSPRKIVRILRVVKLLVEDDI